MSSWIVYFCFGVYFGVADRRIKTGALLVLFSIELFYVIASKLKLNYSNSRTLV